LCKLGVYLHGVLLHKLTAGLIIARAAYALDFGQQLAEEAAQSLVVVEF